jgi:hypothetical protein
MLQTFSTVVAEGCEQRGLSSELVDLASADPEERLLEEVCYLACNSSVSYCRPNRKHQKIL